MCNVNARSPVFCFGHKGRGVGGGHIQSQRSRDARLSSHGRGSIGVAQHRVEGAGEVVGVVAAVVLLRHGHQAGQADEEQEEQVDRERGPEDPKQEGLVL